MNYLKTIVYILIINVALSCVSKKQHSPHFDDQKFYSALKSDKFFDYILCLKFNGSDSCRDYENDFRDLEFLEDLINNGDTIMLNSLFDFHLIFYDQYNLNSLNRHLAFTYFLYEHGFSGLPLFDDMLQLALAADTTNIVANYELAKLRFENGMIADSKFLIDNLNKYIPQNHEIIRIKNEIHENYESVEYKKDLNYFNFLLVRPNY